MLSRTNLPLDSLTAMISSPYSNLQIETLIKHYGDKFIMTKNLSFLQLCLITKYLWPIESVNSLNAYSQRPIVIETFQAIKVTLKETVV